MIARDESSGTGDLLLSRSREVGDVNKEIEEGDNTDSKGPGDAYGLLGILDFGEGVVNVAESDV